MPTAPAGITATTGNGQVTLAWNAVPDATSYNIYWSTTSGVTPANGSLIADATAPFIQTGLTNGTTYYYLVTAVNANGESAASTRVNCTPMLPLPTDVTATPGNSRVTIAWTPVPGAISYNIWWSTSPGVTPLTGTRIAGVTTASYTQTPLNNGTICYYAVTAVFASGESAASAPVCAIPSAKPAPAEPAGVTATPGNGRVAISWTPVPGATSYNIYWSTISGVTPINGFLKAGATAPYIHSGLNNGTTYYYVVTAINSNGESTASSQVSVSPSA